MKKAIIYIVLAVALIGLLFNMDLVFNMILSTIIFLAVISVILYAVYYFFLLTPSQREYKRALRKAKRKNPKR